jgi:hypothetical protein
MNKWLDLDGWMFFHHANTNNVQSLADAQA